MNKQILEALLYKIPEIRTVYSAIHIDNVSSAEHAELNNIVSHFTKPHILIVCGREALVYIIQRETKNLYHVIKITSSVSYSACGRGDIFKECTNCLFEREFSLAPVCKKIIYVDSFDKQNIYGKSFINTTSKDFIQANKLSIEVLSKEEGIDGRELLREILAKWIDIAE